MSIARYFQQNTVVDTLEAARIRARAVVSGQNISLIDPVVDETWARNSTGNATRPSNYFDYFFAGEDIQVRIAEIPDSDPKFGDIPILSLGFSIEQEKTPVYGFWSYTYDGMMRGTRIVTGGFSIATKYPNYMIDLLATAAYNRAHKTNADAYAYPKGLTEDDKLIDQYWTKTIDPVVQQTGGQVMFSIHPPFSLIVIYGLQTTSVPLGDGSNHWNNYYEEYYSDQQNTLMTDHNQRIAESAPSYENRLVVDAVELKSCERSFMPNGQLCTETYSFIARDVLVPRTPATSQKMSGPPVSPPKSGPAVPFVD